MPKPAARSGDDHECLYPHHRHGPISGPCDPTVLIEGNAAARYSDMASCVGATDTIASGAGTVFIGKLPAARLDEPSEHGGLVRQGAAGVMIGEDPAGVTVIRRGKFLIIVNDLLGKIYIVGVVEYAGDGVSATFIDGAVGDINQVWSGSCVHDGRTYEVESMVTGRRSIGDPAANQVEVVHSDNDHAYNSRHDPAHQPFNGDGTGYQHDTDLDGRHTPAHEFGHSLGLPDEYETTTVNGERMSIPAPGSGIMGSTAPNQKPTQANYDSLLSGNGLE